MYCTASRYHLQLQLRAGANGSHTHTTRLQQAAAAKYYKKNKTWKKNREIINLQATNHLLPPLALSDLDIMLYNKSLWWFILMISCCTISL